MYKFVLNRNPTPWQAPKMTRKGIYCPQAKVKIETRQEIIAIANANDYPYWDGSVEVRFQFIFPIPLLDRKKPKALEKISKGLKWPTRCDCTNLQKFYEDCLQNTIFGDDRHVIKVTSEKRYGPQPQIIIEVIPIKKRYEEN